MKQKEKKYIDVDDVPQREVKNVLAFLNATERADEIAKAVEIPGETDVGINIAHRIIEAKDKLGEFTSLKQISNIKQIGPERFTEIVGALGKRSDVPEPERAQFHKLILENPNYFGTFPEVETEPVKPMKVNKKYEELRCIGFYPEQDLLEAVIDVKLPYGYKGSLCSQGSFEYVRFFIDWNGDGDFTDASDDVGIVSVNVHDIPDDSNQCLDKTKPLSYALTLKVDPKKYPCTRSNLVKVRAILSWDAPPPAGNPNHIPVWGNVVDKWIQIKPAKFFLKDIVNIADLAKLKIDSTMLDLDIPISKAKMLTPVDLKQLYKEKDVPEHRFDFAQISKLTEKVKQDPALMVPYKLDTKFTDIVKNIDIILAQKSNTNYEELHCLGLNNDLDTLVATLTIKQPGGYSGNLCTKGSYEYVAFWAYVWDNIEQMCSWRYLGMSSVNVHDISSIPPEGLQYAVKLPVDLSNYRDKCSKPRVLKVRAILSWQNAPPVNNPYYNPSWGNRIDALIQLKPGAQVKPSQQIPFISVVGGMAIENISGNPDTVVPSSVGDGYANGPSVYGGFSALDSPFGGVVNISGHISNPPDDPVDSDKLEYMVQYRKSGDPTWHEIANKFKIWISTWNGASWSMSNKQQVATGGYYLYEEDLTPHVQRFVEGNVLAQWHTPVPEGDGLYDIRVLLYKAGALSTPDVPADHISSNVVKVKIDNTRPDAKISLDAGACTRFEVGDTIKGKFTATDKHIWKYSLTVEPSVASPPVVDPTGETYPSLSAPGKTDELFKLKTTNTTTPCGYVLHLYVWDRTIVNNHMDGNRKGATVGLCLLKKE